LTCEHYFYILYKHACNDKALLDEVTSTLKMEAARSFRKSRSFY